MIDNKKAGIRLRHLEQQTQPEIKRDPSPNNFNRKKIFQRLPQRSHDRLPADQPAIDHKTEQNDYATSKEFQQLIETLKKKSMEIQLRDNMIKSLNREIDSLSKQLQAKDKHISKLLLQMERLQRVSSLTKQVSNNEHKVFQSFGDAPEMTAFAAPQQHYTVNNEANPQRKRLASQSPGYQSREQTTLSNKNLKTTASQEILSPFMALNSKKEESVFESQITVKNKDDRRISITKDKLPNAFPQSYAFKKKGQFDVWNDNDRKVSTSAVVNRQLQKFDLFGQNDYKSQIRAETNLQIENSRQFKFEDFDPNQFQDFGQASY